MSTPVLQGTSTGGKINLSGYPGLTYAPAQWGEGIRLAHNGTPIEEVIGHPDILSAVGALKARAAAHGLAAWGDVCDAVRYAEANGIEPKPAA